VTQTPDIFAALAAPFLAGEVKTRTQGGRQLSYITARTAMNRLDTVLGPENWRDSYRSGGENSIVCRLEIRLNSGEWLAKEDAGGFAGMSDSGDDDKSGYSDSFKRACVKFGIGRYLYRDGVPDYAQGEHGEVRDEPARSQPQPPRDSHREEPRDHAPRGNGNGGGYSGPPRSGKALFAWTKEQEQRHSVGLLKYLNGWAKLQDFPGRMVDWDAEQVALAHAEAVRKLQSVQAGGYEEAHGEDGTY
jgi:hypothetical protein